MTWGLILFLWTGKGTATVATIFPGFSSEALCKKAGAVVTKKKYADYYCVQQTEEPPKWENRGGKITCDLTKYAEGCGTIDYGTPSAIGERYRNIVTTEAKINP